MSLKKKRALGKKSLELFSPTKINLFLHVLGKREDGYHEIASLMQATSLGDTLHIEAAQEDRLTCSRPTLPCDSSNLILQAAEVFRKGTGLPLYAHFHLEKKVPIAAGLGGGSGNAATTLWALNLLAGRPASLAELQAWGSLLGSDVPFFFSHGSAYCTGRGEKIEEVALETIEGWIAVPTQKEAGKKGTQEIYAHLSCQKSVFPLEKKEFKAHLKQDFVNDLEAAAFSLRPALRELKKALLAQGFATVVMSGSGSSFFCLGKVLCPSLPDVHFFPFCSIQRNQDCWYAPSSSIMNSHGYQGQ